MAEIQNLAGVATSDLVDKIGTGRFEASYINWARTANLLHQHAPGWMVDYIPAADGGLLHRSPVGGYLLIGFKHQDGTTTPAVPQAVMDNRNKSIDFDSITSRDITDTQRRGMCMAAAMTFGLAFELWAKMPMESGYAAQGGEQGPKETTTGTPQQAPSAADAKGSSPTEAAFREAATKMGVNTAVIDTLVEKLNGAFAKGLETLQKTTGEALNAKYGSAALKEKKTTASQW
jgi:hypothetical protein